MGRTTVTLAKRKLAKDDLRRKSKELDKEKMNKISEEIDICEELEVVASPWVIPVIPLAAKCILKALIKAIILWVGALCGKHRSVQKDVEEKDKRSTRKKNKIRPKRKTNQNETSAKSEEQPSKSIESEKHEEFGNIQTSPMSNIPPEAVPQQDNVGWITATTKRKEKRESNKHKSLSILTSRTSVAQRPARQELLTKCPTARAISLPTPTKDAVPPGTNPWKKVDINRETVLSLSFKEFPEVVEAPDDEVSADIESVLSESMDKLKDSGDREHKNFCPLVEVVFSETSVVQLDLIFDSKNNENITKDISELSTKSETPVREAVPTLEEIEVPKTFSVAQMLLDSDILSINNHLTEEVVDVSSEVPTAEVEILQPIELQDDGTFIKEIKAVYELRTLPKLSAESVIDLSTKQSTPQEVEDDLLTPPSSVSTPTSVDKSGSRDEINSAKGETLLLTEKYIAEALKEDPRIWNVEGAWSRDIEELEEAASLIQATPANFSTGSYPSFSTSN